MATTPRTSASGHTLPGSRLGRVIEQIRAHQESAGADVPRIRRRLTVDRDADLVERLCRHEPGATEALVAVYGDRVYRLALGITGNHSDAEEVVQDALWTVVRRIETFRGEAAFGSWVYRISANVAHQKRRARRVERNEMSWDDLGPSFEESGAHVHPDSDWAPRLKDPALQAELQSVLCTAIDELPAGHRAIFLLHDVEGLSPRAMAAALRAKVATIKSRVYRARLFLRCRLTVYGGSAEATRGAVGGSTSEPLYRGSAVESTTRQLASNEVAVTKRTATRPGGARTWQTPLP
jgi:RNA polymerase sigma-70 factor, ECF subfamily